MSVDSDPASAPSPAPPVSRCVVQKFGGSSVASAELIQRVARRIAATRAEHERVVVVVSAMGDSTDELLSLAHKVNSAPPPRELDQLLSTGETITAPLMAMALERLGVPAISLTGPQAGIRTSSVHRSARIVDIVPERIVDELDHGRVVVVAGFQGVSDALDVTTLGRGGSDTTAVALAVELGAARCEIFTDVAGVYTADPRVEPRARPLPEITYGEMLEFAAVGAKVLHPRAVEIGETYSVPIVVRSTFEDHPGTLICQHPAMEDRLKIRGIAHHSGVAKVILTRVPDRPGVAAQVFGPIGKAGINVDIIVQNVSHDGFTDISFIIAEEDLPRSRPVLEEVARDVRAEQVVAATDIATVSVVGTALLGTPGMAARIFQALSAKNINVEQITTSQIHVTVVIARDRVAEAVRALHDEFELESD
ncbi:MAG: aspartate kinase [Candidatus Dormibacteria bacterium]|jgi:aspartate kinase